MLARLLCAVAGHRYAAEREMPSYDRKIRCKRCGTTWEGDDGLRVTVHGNDDLRMLYAPGGPLHPSEAKPKEGETT